MWKAKSDGFLQVQVQLILHSESWGPALAGGLLKSQRGDKELVKEKVSIHTH